MSLKEQDQTANLQNEGSSLSVEDSLPLVNKARLKWACRRGMLELDVLFIPFVDEAYDDLSAKDQRTFERLLT
ncbi:MAG: succinate dehydrogenase assembly factor 2, partial [Colwellia sp.]